MSRKLFRPGFHPRGPSSPDLRDSEMGIERRLSGMLGSILYGHLAPAIRRRIDLALFTGKTGFWKIINTSGKIVNWSYVHSTSHIDGEADEITLDQLKPDAAVDFNAQDITNLGGLAFNSASELTISSGAVTATQGHHTIDTEGDAADDDLDTINGGESGEILLILPADDARTIRIRNGVGNLYTKHQTEVRAYGFNSPAGGSGTFYVAGWHDWSVLDANLTQVSPTVTHGSADIAHAGHAGLVAGGAGATDAGTVSIVVSGTSIDDDGNRSAADSETIVADITAMALNQYFETTKKWIGQVTYTLTGAGGAATFNADFNYGLSKYEDFGNQDFTITLLECVGLAGASDTSFNIRLFHHNSADWTYAASGFVPGPTAGDTSELANMNTDHSTEQNLANDEFFAYKRTNLNTDVAGSSGEGLILEVTTGANRAVEDMDIHFGVHTAPKFAYMATTKQHLMFMKHGPNWLEL